MVVGDPSTHTAGVGSDDRQLTIFRKEDELQHHRFDVGRAVLFRHFRVSLTWEGGRRRGFRA